MAVPERFRIVPMILVMGTIFYLSHQPGDSLDLSGIPGLDKAAHFSVYGLLAAAVLFAHSEAARKTKSLKTAAVTAATCLLYGISDEFHQAFVPGRFVSGADLAADFFGGLFICLVWLKWRRSDV